jgi:hypothetical protein
MVKLVLLAAALFTLLSSITHASELTQAEAEKIQRLISPHIIGDTLFIDGTIDSHIYDFLSYAGSELKPVKFVELNSLGGNNDWGLQIAQKIKDLKLTTKLKSGKFCASACTYIFAAGFNRQAERGTWLGIHGARLGAGYTTTFQGLCFVDLEGGVTKFMPELKGCQSFLANWYEVSLKATLDAFALMESNGVSAQLRLTYFAMPDADDWQGQLNVVRKPDWPLNAEDAVKYNLVTEII